MAKSIRTVAGALLLFVAAPALADKAKHDTVMPAEAMKWEDGPVKGTHVANLWGRLDKGGPYGVLVKFDAGLMHELHHHTQTLRIVLLSGTFVHHGEGGAETKLGPGSYLLQAGDLNHISGCAPGADCEFFMMSNDKFDFIPEKQEAEPAEAKPEGK